MNPDDPNPAEEPERRKAARELSHEVLSALVVRLADELAFPADVLGTSPEGLGLLVQHEFSVGEELRVAVRGFDGSARVCLARVAHCLPASGECFVVGLVTQAPVDLGRRPQI